MFVGLAGTAGNYLIHQFKKRNENRVDDINIRAVVKSSYAPTSSIVYLQIWNGTTLSWETIDSENTKGANVKLSLDAQILTNDSNYYDFEEQIAIRVYQQNNSSDTHTLSIDQIRISFIAQYKNTYLATDNKYSDSYDSVSVNYNDVYPDISTPEYTPKYPHKNPQDDL